MTNHDPDRSEPATEEALAEAKRVPPAPETEHIEEDGEPLGANFA